MAYENRNAAYDLSLFDQASAAPLPKRDEEVEKVKEPKKKTGKKVISLPEEELHKIRKRRHNPLKVALGTIGGAAVAMIIATIIIIPPIVGVPCFFK